MDHAESRRTQKNQNLNSIRRDQVEVSSPGIAELQVSALTIAQHAAIEPNTLTPADVMQLQKTLGNEAVAQFLEGLNQQRPEQKTDIGAEPTQSKPGNSEPACPKEPCGPCRQSVIQRAVGFEFELQDWRSWQTDPKKGVHRVAKGDPIIEGAGFSAQGEDVDEDTSSVEFVIDPPLATWKEAEPIVTAAQDLAANLNKHQGKDLDAQKFSGKEGYHIRPDNGKCGMQATAGIRLEQIPALFDEMKQASESNLYLKENILPGIKDQKDSPELKGLITLIIHYLLKGYDHSEKSESDYPKGIITVMARTWFPKLFSMVPEIREKRLTSDQLVALVMGRLPDWAGDKKEPFTKTAFTQMDPGKKVRLTLTREEWLKSIMDEGFDKLSYWADERFEGMGFLGNKTDVNDDGTEAPIFELRGLGSFGIDRNAPINQWVVKAHQVFELENRVNDGKTFKKNAVKVDKPGKKEPDGTEWEEVVDKIKKASESVSSGSGSPKSQVPSKKSASQAPPEKIPAVDGRAYPCPHAGCKVKNVSPANNNCLIRSILYTANGKTPKEEVIARIKAEMVERGAVHSLDEMFDLGADSGRALVQYLKDEGYIAPGTGIVLYTYGQDSREGQVLFHQPIEGNNPIGIWYTRSSRHFQAVVPGCFITTACVKSRGLADDCDELTTLRQFRDGYLKAQPGGTALIELYYRIAPRIVAAIDARETAGVEYDRLYSVIQLCVGFIKNGNNQQAKAIYTGMVKELTVKYLKSKPSPTGRKAVR